jgi:predicted TIM-barrel fold metal-dependent hydrolase
MIDMKRIDTHHHYIPPAYLKWLSDLGIKSGGIDWPDWSEDRALKVMDKLNIETAILSLSSPGVFLKDIKIAKTKAREVNEFGADLVRGKPDRFGVFATLPLPDVDSSLEEISYAVDTLHADGIVLLANYQGTYLGDKSFEPVMAEINRRNIPVFLHPNNIPGPEIAGIPAFAADFLLDTVRAVENLVLSGTMQKYKNLKIILAHAGGFVPYAAYRLILPILQHASIVEKFEIEPQKAVNEVLSVFKGFYYDIALSASPTVFPSLLSLVGPDHITYGSDWPFSPEVACEFFSKQFEHYNFDTPAREAIEWKTAKSLFKRFTDPI